MSSKLPKGSRITGEGRSDLAGTLVQRYQAGESIRSIAEDIGRSYGFVHGVLVESGTRCAAAAGRPGPGGQARREALRAKN